MTSPDPEHQPREDKKELYGSDAEETAAPGDAPKHAATTRLPQAAEQCRRISSRFHWAVGLSVGVCVLSLGIFAVWPSATPAARLDSELERQLDERLADICHARTLLQEKRSWQPHAHDTRRTKTSAPRLRQPVQKVRDAGTRPTVEPVDNNQGAYSSEAYYRSYGSPEHYAAMNAGPSGLLDSTGASTKNASQNRGAILQARLVTAAASEPTGAPVVAVLLRQTQLGVQLWPRGTEVHGVVRGGSSAGDRVFAEFTFLRLATGETCDITGHAQDPQGRLGMPGRRHLTGATAQSVGIASVGRAAGVAGRELAGGVGRVLGAGVEGAVESGSNKARRVDRDESVVVAERSTVFNVYLSAAHCD